MPPIISPSEDPKPPVTITSDTYYTTRYYWNIASYSRLTIGSHSTHFFGRRPFLMGDMFLKVAELFLLSS